MPVIKPANLVWTCRACGYKIQNMQDNEAFKNAAFSHSIANHGLVEENRDFFFGKFRSFYDIN